MNEHTEVFQRHRGAVFGVAYRMLGTASEAEDVVQETWLRWDRADRSTVDDPRAYLTRIAARASLDQLRRARARRETYVGPWLPEPLLTGPDVAEGVVDDAATAESVSVALLVVLETLSPLERAVFVLREAFGMAYGEIAETLGRSATAVRQLGHRAREHVRARQPRFDADDDVRAAVTRRFLDATMTGDIAALLAMLAPDVEFVGDSGGQVRAPKRIVRGYERVARLMVAISPDIPAGTEVEYREVNGGPAAVFVLDGAPYAVAVLEVDPETSLIARANFVGNPDKLTALAASWR
ncbi:RNA polymerase ECF family sigma subunit [Herbihabitans rhizosphaerae]|uniref:RNA polymerase ECF family sigma subunit n=1 Tax=Herbihabitans rhizosphaerae TaxID=1872711 RepID=A0A4Q7L4P1_9PSEU|nr:RNA polymerase sigma factor SigJ [Herbihabitans rhizosphaerae]RZS44194.1 RNA polymerase ECF family sigma subunit [Herbihabitans rhizosphaerae]